MGYFDSGGHCLMISSGAGDPPIPFSFKQEVPDGLGPNTCEFDPQTKKIKTKERELPPPPVDTLGPTLAELEARIKQLEQKVK